MVGVAQLVELQFVALAVAGSTPVAHPKYKEQRIRCSLYFVLSVARGYNMH